MYWKMINRSWNVVRNDYVFTWEFSFANTGLISTYYVRDSMFIIYLPLPNCVQLNSNLFFMVLLIACSMVHNPETRIKFWNSWERTIDKEWQEKKEWLKSAPTSSVEFSSKPQLNYYWNVLHKHYLKLTLNIIIPKHRLLESYLIITCEIT